MARGRRNQRDSLSEQLTIDGEPEEPMQLTLDGGAVAHWDAVAARERAERERREREEALRREEEARRNPPIDYSTLETLPIDVD